MIGFLLYVLSYNHFYKLKIMESYMLIVYCIYPHYCWSSKSSKMVSKLSSLNFRHQLVLSVDVSNYLKNMDGFE